MNQFTIEDLEMLAETTDVECKAAQGRNGFGEIPNSIWETYSAMANTSGGHIYLGIEKTPGHRFIYRGIKDIQKIQKAFWDTINAWSKPQNSPDLKEILLKKLKELGYEAMPGKLDGANNE